MQNFPLMPQTVEKLTTTHNKYLIDFTLDPILGKAVLPYNLAWGTCQCD